MATTSTNKQPLLVDRVFHNVVATDNLASQNDTSLNVEGSNSSAVLLNCQTTDGGIVEDLYTIARSTTKYTALFYFSTAVDYLRPEEAIYIGSVESSDVAGTVTSVANLPKVLAPLPSAGTEAQVRALYVPRGKVLWVTLQLAGPVNVSTTPIVGAQGGFY